MSASAQAAGCAPAVSVIVPVYNVGELLDRCLGSLLGQTLSDLEVVLVDDGSTDGSGGRCDAWAARDGRVRVIHQANGGLSAARNKGIACARGRWIGFVDSDDYVAPWMYETLVGDLAATGAQVATCDVVDVYGDAVADFTAPGAGVASVISGWEAVSAMARSELPRIWVPTRLYPHEVFDTGFSFPVGRQYEDAYTVVDLFSQVERVSVNTARLYCYCHREESITSAPYGPHAGDVVEAWEHGREQVARLRPELLPDFAFRCWWARAVVLDKMVRAGGHDGSPEERELVGYLRAHFDEVKDHPALTSRRRILGRLLRLSLALYRAVVRRAPGA